MFSISDHPLTAPLFVTVLFPVALWGTDARGQALDAGALEFGFADAGAPVSLLPRRGAGLDFGTTVRPVSATELFLHDNLAVAILGDWTTEPAVAPAGAMRATNNLPPTVSVQYHFDANGPFVPFVGAGLNNPSLLERVVDGAASGAQLDEGWGPALRLGIDVAVSDNEGFRTDLSWVDMDDDPSGVDAGTGSAFDTWVLGFSYVFRF